MTTNSEQRILDWFELNNYDFFDEIRYDEDNEIYNDGDIQELISDAESFSDRGFASDRQRDNFNELWQGQIVPEWDRIADTNTDRLRAEIKTQTELIKELRRNATTTEEEKEYSKQLKNINRFSFAATIGGEKRRAKKAFRQMFS